MDFTFDSSSSDFIHQSDNSNSDGTSSELGQDQQDIVVQNSRQHRRILRRIAVRNNLVQRGIIPAKRQVKECHKCSCGDLSRNLGVWRLLGFFFMALRESKYEVI